MQVHSKDPERPVKENFLHKLPLSNLHIFAIWALIVAVIVGVVLVENHLPNSLTLDDEKVMKERFIGDRAMAHLEKLTDIGPRVCCSYENEVLAVELLKLILEDIKSKSSVRHKFEIDVPKFSGAFPLTFLDNMVNVYRNVQSIVVKVSSHPEVKTALLLNCHYDTVPESPGASDDGAGCAVLLEVLEVIAKSSTPLRNNLIFLFNGAEENFMQASHGFITQHKWANEVRAFLNIEACGAGGREVLFQAGPHSPYLVETYASAVPYPYASSLAQEIFESGFIPGDTDFRIFRDFGNVSGLDLAWSSNGYVYHTELDKFDRVPPGSVQRTGDNMLALTTALARSDHLSSKKDIVGQPVYFDLLGAFVVIASGWKLIFASLLAPALVYMQIKVLGESEGVNVKCAFNSVLGAVLRGLCAFICAICASALASTVTPGLAWYSQSFILPTLFAAPGIACGAAVLLMFNNSQRKRKSHGWLLCMRYSTALSLCWTFSLFVAFLFRLRSGFVAWATLPTTILARAKPGPGRAWLYILGNALPFVQTVYLSLGSLKISIPVLGRSGSTLNADLICSLLVSFLSLCCVACALPLLLATQRPWAFVQILLGFWLLTLSHSYFNPFPYRADTSPQRFMFLHTRRVVHYDDDKVSFGYWTPNMDALSPHTLDDFVPGVKHSMEISREECDEHIFCGAPYYLPVLSFISRTHYLEAAAPPKLPYEISVNVTSLETEEGFKRYRFQVIGPNHVVVILSPVLGAEVVSSSLTEGKPLQSVKWKDRETHFFFMSDASNTEKLLYDFHIDVKVSSKMASDYVLDVSVAGHHMFQKYKLDINFKEFLSRLPKWATATYWQCDLHLYRF